MSAKSDSIQRGRKSAAAAIEGELKAQVTGACWVIGEWASTPVRTATDFKQHAYRRERLRLWRVALAAVRKAAKR